MLGDLIGSTNGNGSLGHVGGHVGGYHLRLPCESGEGGGEEEDNVVGNFPFHYFSIFFYLFIYLLIVCYHYIVGAKTFVSSFY